MLLTKKMMLMKKNTHLEMEIELYSMIYEYNFIHMQGQRFTLLT